MNRLKNMKLVIALFLILTASIVINFYLYSSFKKEFVHNHSYLVFPFGRNQMQNLNNATSGLPELTFIGDSRAHAWGNSFKNSSFEIYNFGDNGFSTLQKRLKLNEFGYKKGGDIAVIQIGVNDLKCISLFQNRKDDIIKGCIKNIGEIVSKVAENDSIVILTTIFPVPKIPIIRRLVYNYMDLNKEIKYINQEIYKLESPKILIFDSYNILLGKDGFINDKYVKDYLHLNAEGYDILNDSLINFITKIHIH